MISVLIVLVSLLWFGVASADDIDWRMLVHQVIVTRADGAQELGSAVPLVGGRLVTNCHVIRDGARIEVRVGGIARLARADLRDAYRDLCFLDLPYPHGEPMPIPMIDVGETRVGMEVLAVGYPGGEFAVHSGRIIGLHYCECDGGRVIQTSAEFDQGASGGGLFDREGRLIGILTFKARSGGNFHFALPVGWLRHVTATTGPATGDGATFWENPRRDSAYFLAACDLGAQEKWPSLERLAREWSEHETSNPEAWMALGRARRGLGEAERAAEAFQQALMLDSTHAEAHWALQQLEFELNRSLSIRDRL